MNDTLPFLPFLMFAVVASITPGPTNVIVLSHSARRGVAATLPIIIGGCGGAALLVLTVGIGIGDALAAHPLLQRAMAWTGVLWLSRLAWQIWRSPAAAIEADGAGHAGNAKAHDKPLGLAGAAGLQLVNPKTWMMALAVVSVFSGHDPDQSHQVILLSLIFFVVSLPCMGVWAVLGAGAAHFIRSPIYMKRFERLMALVLLASAWGSLSP
ncbi:LysE family translocator [Cupriavidus pauculus]|uniref:Lysine transporter LysE n=1 Tax=Cupriavidus pauculus TaxID=82633 RepID=A0A2N5C9V2_9BURK|nr:LysE family translocator [Cupriavidus pauculus]PLP99005.1 lysine transporter LysE [Cupriavidus pauculus]